MNNVITLIQRQEGGLMGIYFRSTDESSLLMRNAVGIDAFPATRFDAIMPKLVAKGYMIAVIDYDLPATKWNAPSSPKTGGDARSTDDPCNACRLKGICDHDECGRKLFSLFTNKKNDLCL